MNRQHTLRPRATHCLIVIALLLVGAAPLHAQTTNDASRPNDAATSTPRATTKPRVKRLPLPPSNPTRPGLDRCGISAVAECPQTQPQR